MRAFPGRGNPPARALTQGQFPAALDFCHQTANSCRARHAAGKERTMDLKATEYAVDDRIATITLSRPHRGNAWTGTPADLVTPGDPSFAPFAEDFAYHFALSKPVIAAINGAAAGAGLVLACYADIRFAVPGAKLTTAHGPLNLPAEYGLSWLLPRLIGGARAMELLLSSRKFLTDEAHAIGLVHRLVAPGELIAETRAYAQDLIARVSPEALRQTKRQTYLDFHRDVGASVRDANALMSAMVKQPDYREAIAAFLAKRPAEWSGG